MDNLCVRSQHVHLRLRFYVDDEEILRVDPGPDGFWKFSGLDETTYDNPWREGSRMAPFDQEVRMLTG